MPYRLNPDRPVCVQVKHGDRWQKAKCHPTRSRARAHLTALRINVPESVLAESVFSSKTPPRSRRKLGRSINDRLMDANLRHRHALLMTENGIAAKVAKAYEEALEEIEKQLNRIASREDALTNLGRVRRNRLLALQARIGEALQIGDAAAQKAVADGVTEIAMVEANYQTALIARLAPAGITLDLVGPDEALLRRILEEPLGGEHYANRFRKNHRGTLRAIRQALAETVALGEGVDAAAYRLRRAVTKLSKNRAITIVRSEIQRVANRAAQEAYVANAGPTGVVKGIAVVETLDGRTCLVCMAKDGQTFPPGERPSSLPPYHANCRGFITPVLKSWEELGIDRRELPASTRASMNGQVPQPVTYPDWFADQDAAFQREVLGVTRYQLYRSGDLKLTDMDKNGRILPVSALPSLN